MAVQFILGRSGTGKTHHCVRAIADALLQKSSQSLLLLVPEQATYQASRAILSDPRITGYNRLHVLSFDRLVYLVLGKNAARPTVSRLGRTMVVQRVLRDCASKLTILKNSARIPGLGLRLADTIAKLQQYANTPDDIDNLVRNLKKQRSPGLAAAKFADIAVVFKEYLDFIEGKFLDPAIQMIAACRAVTCADFVRGAKLWVDGFAGFTTAELALLTELLKVVEDAQIALCLDPSTVDLANPDKDQVDPADLFSPTAQTYADLVERIKKCKLKIAAPLVLDKPCRFSQSPALAHLERSIFSQGPAKIAADDKIRIVSAPSARAEAQFVAAQITKLVRHNGLRYRDIAVIASDIDSYENYIKTCFEDYGIPVFIDKRRPLNQHPVIELICSALAAVTNDFPPGDVFAYLKTDLLDLERDEVDLLENYCIAFGITPSDWKSPRSWRYAADKTEQFSEQRVDQIRQKAIAPLIQLGKQLADGTDSQDAIDAGQFTKILFDFLEAAGVRKRLSGWVEQALQRGDFTAADEHRQLYDRLIDVFDEIGEAFTGVPLTCSDYLAVITSAFSQMTLAFIPPNLDQVLVGSIERSRHPDLRAVFLIGATERQFPVPLVFDSILNEEDRVAAQAFGLELPPGVRQELAGRAYLAYIAFTRPSEFLCVTYPAVDRKANNVARSPFVDNLLSLFENLEAESISFADTPLEEISNVYDLEDALCCRLGKQTHTQTDGRPEGLLRDILKDNQLAELGSRVTNAVNYNNDAILDGSVVSRLFDKPLSSSASRLSTFAACPYKHFARYVLDLKKRDEFKLEPLDLGDFYHRVLDGFTKRAVAEKFRFETVAPASLTKILNEEIEKLCRDDSFISKFKAHSPRNSFIVVAAAEYLRDCVLAISQTISAGDFRPVMSEVAFGQPKSAGSKIGEFTITLDDGRKLSLNGRIDRLDVATVNGRKVALVFDYKKRSKDSFNWAEFFYGLDIQLAVYMLAVRNAAGKIADDIAGAFYFPIEVSSKSKPLNEIAADRSGFTHKARGIFNGEYTASLDRSASKDSCYYNFYVTTDGQPYGKYNYLGALRPANFEAFLNFSLHKITALAGQIVSGRIIVSPYRLSGKSPCSGCEYKPVCRFDWQINDYNLLSPTGKQQVLSQIANTDEPKER